MLFYREAVPMSYHALSVCGLRSNQDRNNGSLLSNEIWARVTVEYKRGLSRTLGPFLLLPSSQEELLCFSAFSRIVLFPPPPRSPTRGLTYLMYFYLLIKIFTGGESFNPTFPEEILIFVYNLSFN